MNLMLIIREELYNKNNRSYAIPPALLGIGHDYPNLTNWVNENLEPSLANEFKKTDHQCWDSNEMFTNQDIGKYFKRGWQSVFDPLPNSVVQSAGSFPTDFERLHADRDRNYGDT
jgi:hypothetical protein